MLFTFQQSLLGDLTQDKHISQPGYFSNKNGTELAARGSQLKDYYGLDDPNQEITEDMQLRIM